MTEDQIYTEQFKPNKVALFNNDDNNILRQLESHRNKINQCDQASEAHHPNQVQDDDGGQN